MDKDQMLQRLSDVQLKLEANVGEAYQTLKSTVDTANEYTQDQYEEALKAYHRALNELDEFMENADEQRKRLVLWVKSNKVLLAIGGGLLIGGLLLGRILIDLV